jgi:DNA polymerase/3'-5' exonuclease PolX
MKGKCSEHLKRIAELQENDFKRGGYERAAVAVKELEDNLVDLEGLSDLDFQQYPGIGKSISAEMVAFFESPDGITSKLLEMQSEKENRDGFKDLPF